MKPYVGAIRTHLALLAGLIVVLAAEPLFARASEIAAQLADTTFGVLCLVMFLSLCRESWERRTGLLLFMPALASNVAHAALTGYDDQLAAIAFHGTLAVFLGFAVVVIVRQLTRASVIRADDVIGAVVGYILAALAWSHVYGVAYILAPTAFGVNPEIAPQLADWRLRRTLFNHLSFTTLTTIGYSDITPVGSPLYALVWVETIFGQFYMAVVVAQLVGMKLAQAIKGGNARAER
jgi:ion channel